MGKFNIGGTWYDAQTYAAARDMHNAQQVPAAVVPVAPPVVAAVINPIVTPVDNFAGRSATQFGIGEEIDLSFNSLPPHPAAFFGGLQWAIKSGDATLTAPVGANGTARLVMGSTAGAVILELRTVAALPLVKATKTLWTVTPTSAVIVPVAGTGIYHRQGTASAGFYGEIQFRPTNVSFYRCEFREGASPIRATGSMSVAIARTAPTSSSEGQSHAVQSELNNLQGARHPVLGSWIAIGAGNAVTGSVMQGQDDISSDTMDPPFAAGTFDWDIHWFIRVVGTMKSHQFQTATHSEVVTATGQMTISKGGHTVVCQAAAADSDK